MPLNDDKQSSVGSAATTVTTPAGNLVGGLARTGGGVVGALGTGLGGTINSVSGGALSPAGDGLASLSQGLQGGTDSIAKGVERAGQGKSP